MNKKSKRVNELINDWKNNVCVECSENRLDNKVKYHKCSCQYNIDKKYMNLIYDIYNTESEIIKMRETRKWALYGIICKMSYGSFKVIKFNIV